MIGPPLDIADPPTSAGARWWWSALESEPDHWIWPLSASAPWPRGRWRLLFPGIFLVYLLGAGDAVGRHSSGLGVVVGDLILLTFAAVYLVAVPSTWGGVGGRFWLYYAALVALFAAEVPFAHEGATHMLVYLVVMSVAALGMQGLPLVALYIGIAVFGPAAVPGWNLTPDADAAVSLVIVALTMFAVIGLIRTNRALAAARGEVARLAAENERSRIARDLHDLLGHSLTTITVKAALASRLTGTDIDRAATEMAEVEALSRQALVEVRAAVADYREVTLAGELASGREVLRAAGVDARLPNAVDEVAPEHRALFGWVLREGVTNVVRHARATVCTVTLGPTWIEITDDGPGAPAPAGSGTGLRGLRERVTDAGGRIEAGPVEPVGWRLRAEVPA